MTGAPTPVVYDCNVYFQALVSGAGPASACVKLALDAKVSLFCSRVIIAEVRRISDYPHLRAKFRQLTDQRIDDLISAIERAASFIDMVPAVFSYDRDPTDAHYINLALATRSKYVVSRDKDLLDLMDLARSTALEFKTRFPGLEIIDPAELLRRVVSLPERRESPPPG